MATMGFNESDGFLLLDSSMRPVLANPAAVQILAYPRTAMGQTDDMDEYLVHRIRAVLVSKESSSESAAVVPRFTSGRRHYVCRTYRLDVAAIGNSQVSLAVVLERASGISMSLVQLSQKFHLTAREREVAHFLLQGLTSKEIGMRMQISANTVKAFLRLIMMKMGVSTRSGVVGKALVASLETSGTKDYFQAPSMPHSDI